ncbi:MAG: hypothetical protein K5854_09570 [Prevotella sp.]|nr:hypothetical protein [Prevotella sp.]
MKELSIEEKVKRYDEALEKARKELQICGSSDCDAARQIFRFFPELKESEDEKIRKWLINEIKINHHNLDEDSVDFVDKAIAWLEKQDGIDKASYEIAEKEKQEFVGDGFIKCHANFQDFKEGNTYWLEYIGDDNYSVRSDNLLGKTYHITPCQLYTIFKKQTWLEKRGEQKPANKVETKFHEGEWIAQGCNILKIRCAGSEYYCYETVGGYVDDMLASEIDSLYHLYTLQDAKDGDVLHSPSHHLIWIYKDDKNYHACVNLNYATENITTNGFIAIPMDACPATKDEQTILFSRMKEAGYEWDAEKKELKKVENEIEIPFGAKDSELIEATYFISKGFHAEIEDNKVVIKKGEQKPTLGEDETSIAINNPEAYKIGFADGEAHAKEEIATAWSAEDMSKVQRICKYLDEAKKYYADITEVRECIDWLKSLKERYTWKPSDEQMTALRRMKAAIAGEGEIYKPLNSLYEDLRKLK